MEMIECWVDDENVFHWRTEVHEEDESKVESLDDSIVVSFTKE